MLSSARVDRVIDIRALPLSRRRGFSKTPLSTALAESDIDYVHLRAAGNPFRKEGVAGFARYAAHLRQSPEVIAEVLAAAKGHRAALLCVEAEPAECHRSVLASQLGRVRVQHL
jgi:uncharacterized protein (DUF488 family)